MRAFVTGGSGYVGLHILRELLEHGHEVTAVVRAPERLGAFTRDARLRVVVADLEDHARVARALPGHDVCIHAALLWGAPGTELDVRDVAVAAKLFDGAGTAGLSRCILISAAAVHRPFTTSMREEDPLATTDHYGATKAAGELFLRAACAMYGMTGVVVRPGPVVGPPAFLGGSFRTDRRLAGMVAAGLEGRPVEVVRGDGRQFTDVTTLARVTRLLLGAATPQTTYLCVAPEPLTWARIAAMVVEATGSRSEIHVLEPDDQAPTPHFRTDRLEGLLGGAPSATEAMKAHIACLTGRTERPVR